MYCYFPHDYDLLDLDELIAVIEASHYELGQFERRMNAKSFDKFIHWEKTARRLRGV